MEFQLQTDTIRKFNILIHFANVYQTKIIFFFETADQLLHQVPYH